MIEHIYYLITRAYQLYRPPLVSESNTSGAGEQPPSATSETQAEPVEQSQELSSPVGEHSVWIECWLPALQSLARACFDSRRSVRTHALSNLQAALLMRELATELGVHLCNACNFALSQNLLEDFELGLYFCMRTRERCLTSRASRVGCLLRALFGPAVGSVRPDARSSRNLNRAFACGECL